MIKKLNFLSFFLCFWRFFSISGCSATRNSGGCRGFVHVNRSHIPDLRSVSRPRRRNRSSRKMKKKVSVFCVCVCVDVSTDAWHTIGAFLFLLYNISTKKKGASFKETAKWLFILGCCFSCTAVYNRLAACCMKSPAAKRRIDHVP